MEIPKLKIGSIESEIPIVQGGMGVRVSLSSLAAAVAEEGGIGTLSSIGLGDVDAESRRFEQSCREKLIEEIHRAQSLTQGNLAVNIMGVLSNADDLVRTTANAGIRMIVFGAGLPTKLPRLVEDPDISLVPIVSSARAADLILRSWDKRYGRIPHAFILEGPLAGGHLGFSKEQLDCIENYSLENLLPDVLETVRPYEERYGKKIPIIAAGGIYTGEDIARMLFLGASGVQMGTRFVCTRECGVSDAFKQAYLDAGKKDIVIVKSPVGLPGRAIRNRFLKDLEESGKQAVRCPYRCLTACKIEAARYCIARALLNAYFGRVDQGLIFCGQNAHRITEIVSVHELFDELKSGLADALLEHRAA